MVLLGAFENRAITKSVSNQIAVVGVGVNAPGGVEQPWVDTVTSPYATASFNATVANAALHALTVVVTCTSSPLNTSGMVYMGAVSQRVNRTQYANYNALGNALIDRRDLRPYTLYDCCKAGKVVCAYPVDVVDWASQNPLTMNSGTASDNHVNDALSQICLVFPPTAAVIDIVVTVFTEWRINFTDPALASTSVKRDSTSQGFWNQAISFGHQLSGILEGVAGAASGLGQVGALVGPIMSAGRKLAPVAGELGGLMAFA